MSKTQAIAQLNAALVGVREATAEVNRILRQADDGDWSGPGNR